ncbi:MAG: Ribose import ATP-binding protein RbsA [Gemmatimonadaceae bacterium]|nr:Ribose import ATP-binding protein RbsA [Gemmatimonadaceae bacterium]
MTDSALEAIHIVKRFGSVEANRDANLSVGAGEIHAVVGENGAGKSTLMRVLAGLFVPDAGTVRVHGRNVTGWDTRRAIAAGVGMVHQHFMLVPTLTVAENLVLGQEPTRGVRLDLAAASESVNSLCARTGLRVDPSRRVDALSVGEAQRVEILKVLYRGARILILDEPTAVLSPPEVRELWTVLRTLKARGDTVVVITHKLDEVAEISDAVTVMRAGETVGCLRTQDATPAAIARMMVGRDVVLAGDLVRHGDHAPGAAVPDVARRVALEVTDLVVARPRQRPAVDGVSLVVREGEIVGIAGVEGNGQTELIEALAGLRPTEAGSVRLNGREIVAFDVRARADVGISHIPEDRQRRGLVLEYSIADNLILGLQHRFAHRGVMQRDRVRRNADRQIEAFDIRPPRPDVPARALSGGNQQKIVVAREMGRDFSVLLAAQPTRGVDVGAIEFIHARLRAARDGGRAILLVSADLVEVLALADRVAVMYEGRIVVTLPRAQASAEVLGPYMTGAQRGAKLS